MTLRCMQRCCICDNTNKYALMSLILGKPKNRYDWPMTMTMKCSKRTTWRHYVNASLVNNAKLDTIRFWTFTACHKKLHFLGPFSSHFALVYKLCKHEQCHHTQQNSKSQINRINSMVVSGDSVSHKNDVQFNCMNRYESDSQITNKKKWNVFSSFVSSSLLLNTNANVFTQIRNIHNCFVSFRFFFNKCRFMNGKMNGTRETTNYAFLISTQSGTVSCRRSLQFNSISKQPTTCSIYLYLIVYIFGFDLPNNFTVEAIKR